MTTTPRPIAWSFSAVDSYRNCPRKFWAVKIEKLVSDANQYNTRGDDEHKVFDAYLRSRKPLPPSLAKFQPVLDRVLSAPGQLYSEYQLTLDTNYQPCGWKDWDRAWVRAQLDVLIVDGAKAKYIDWKTGKPRSDPTQMKLAAAMIFQVFPAVNEVDTFYSYIHHNKNVPFSFTRMQVPDLWNEFLPTVRQIEKSRATGDWPATPNGLCGYCPYKACPHNTNRS